MFSDRRQVWAEPVKKSAMSATRTHPKESFSYKLSLQDDAFFLLLLFGLTERSSVIVENRVSFWFRLYSGSVSATAFAFTLMNMSLVLFPDRTISPMFNEDFSAAQRAVYPLWCTMCAMLRACVSCMTLSKKYSRDLERATTNIQYEASLAKFWIPSRKHVWMRNIGSFVTFSFLVTVNTCMYARYSALSLPELATAPMTYLFFIENLVFSSSFLGTWVFLGIISVGNLTRMFSWVESEVEEWCKERGRSEEALGAVMHRHNLCWQLTDAYDRVFRTVLGTSTMFCVPIFCLVTTQVIKIYIEREGRGQMLGLVSYLLLWSVSCVSFASIMCIFASSINSAAAAPRKHLMKLTDGHNVSILHFLSRLNEFKIGFTFFDFFVIEKTTILTIFSLMVTYLVVFLQMAQADTLSSQSTTPSG